MEQLSYSPSAAETCAVPRCGERVSHGSRCDRRRKEQIAELETRSGRALVASRGYNRHSGRIRPEVLQAPCTCLRPGCHRWRWRPTT
jgi:hypothetical protein